MNLPKIKFINWEKIFLHVLIKYKAVRLVKFSQNSHNSPQLPWECRCHRKPTKRKYYWEGFLVRKPDELLQYLGESIPLQYSYSSLLFARFQADHSYTDTLCLQKGIKHLLMQLCFTKKCSNCQDILFTYQLTILSQFPQWNFDIPKSFLLLFTVLTD